MQLELNERERKALLHILEKSLRVFPREEVVLDEQRTAERLIGELLHESSQT